MNILRRPGLLVYCMLLFALAACGQQDNNAQRPGKYEEYTLLPNGWKLTPAGTHTELGDLPLNMIVTPDENYAIVSNSGAGEASLSLIDLEKHTEVQRLPLKNTWRGLVMDRAGETLYASGGNNDLVYVITYSTGTLTLRDSILLEPDRKSGTVSVTGLEYLDTKKCLLAVSKKSNTMYVISSPERKVLRKIPMGAACYDVLMNHAETRAYVSLWGAAKVAEVDLSAWKVIREFNVGDHPCEMLITGDDQRLFVTNANHNTTSVIDLQTGRETERINSSLKADAPYGSTPNAITFNADESVLLVANADNNYLALFDISEPGQSRSIGFIPVGWYPTSVKFLKNSQHILVVNAKGLTSGPNPLGPKPGKEDNHEIDQYIGRFFKGSLSAIAYPSDSLLAVYAGQVYRNTPYVSAEASWKGLQKVIPEEHTGKRSERIRHVFYIIKENRTYDQVFGDIKEGNGDETLCLFPEKVTPNMHKLARQYTLFDNFYVDAEVSADGHNWSTAAYATDYVEKTWPTLYGGRGGSYDYEGGVPIASPSSGYIWDAVLNKGLSYRNYGEYVERDPERDGFYRARDAYLRPYTCTSFAGYDLRITDLSRYGAWEKDFSRLLETNSVPDFSLLRLPNDHTAGTRKNYPTVQAMVADNDYALGLVVERIARSNIWNTSIIFVLEDDAQNGSDHVDAHRSPLLVIGPWVKRHFVDHTHYSTSSVLKTIELILGLQPMTQFDLSAVPLLFAVNDEPDFSPYMHLEPNIDLNELNPAGAYGAERCEEMNLTVEDAIPDIEFNEIIWKAVRGADSGMPAPVRSAFVQLTARGETEAIQNKKHALSEVEGYKIKNMP